MRPSYLTFCIQQSLHRPSQYVPTRMEFLVLCMETPPLLCFRYYPK